MTKHLKFYQQLDLDQDEESAWDKWVLISPEWREVEGSRDGPRPHPLGSAVTSPCCLSSLASPECQSWKGSWCVFSSAPSFYRCGD